MRILIGLAWLLSIMAVHAQSYTWTRLAGEGQQFAVTKDETVVRYGANGTYSEKVLATGTYYCDNRLFGDPIRNVAKTCEARTAPATPPSPVPSCWPAQVAGSGTPGRTVLIVPADAARANPAVTAPAGAEPVHVLWWYCPDPLALSGWVDYHLMCAQSKLTQCLLGVPTLNPTAMAAAWKAAPPSPPSDVGIGWAQTAWRKLYGDPGRPAAPPAEAWVVAPAPTNANPPGTRPAYIFIAPATLVGLYSTERVQAGAPCDCNKVSYTSGSTRYCQVGDRADKVAVCVRR